MKKYWYWDEKNVASQLLPILQKAAVVAGTSDTIIGLLAPLTQRGKRALDRIKKRHEKPYIILVSDLAKAALFSTAVMQEKLQPLLKACWPGPLTIILPANESVPDYMKSPSGTIALRMPDHPGLQTILQSVDGLFSTSANRTGVPVPESLENLAPDIVDAVAMIIDDREKKISKPSTIIDATGPHIKVIRQGAYASTFLKKYLF